MPPERRAPANKWAIALAVGICLAFLYIVRLAVLPFLLAAAIAFAADPAVEWLMRKAQLTRAKAALIVYLLLMAAIGGAIYGSTVSLAGELVHVGHDLPELLQRLLHEAFGGDTITLFGRTLNAGDLANQATGGLISAVGQPSQWLKLGLYAFALVTGLTLLIVLTYFFLEGGQQLAASALWLVPPEYRAEVEEMVGRITPMLRRYLVGLLIIFVFASITTWAFIQFVLHLPEPVLLGLITGAFEMIPVIGPAASATLIGLLSLEQHGVWALVAFAVYVTSFRLIIDRLLGPVVLGAAARLHPVIVMFALLAGGLVLGVVGVILAVPVAATVKIVLQHYYSQPMRTRLR